MIGPAHKTGFTLIELSIVLVIIGLVIGGVVAGRDLIKMAELRTVLTDVEQYKTALNAYKLKYSHWPGDDPGAQNMWGTTDCPDFSTNCNGNGNGMWNGGSRGETLYAWHHMSLAGLVSGHYRAQGWPSSTFVSGSSYADRINIPTTPLGGDTGYRFAEDEAGTGSDICTCHSASSSIYGLQGKRLFLGAKFGRENAVESPYNDAGAISPIDAYRIDSKIDDGIAYSGGVRSNSGRDSGSGAGSNLCGPTLINYADPASLFDYDLTNNQRDCAMHFFIR
ncbi:MAG: type II secretion system protein [Alphaproteobacteria bacterium]